MQDAVRNRETTMLALKLGPREVQAAIERLKPEGVCEISGLPGPNQTLVSGDAEAVAKLVAAVKRDYQAVAVPLKVSAPFHCSLMTAAESALRDYLKSVVFGPLARPIIASGTAEVMTTPEQLRVSLSGNVTAPMRLQKGVEVALDRGVRSFVELGPQRKMSAHIRVLTRKSADVAVSQYGPESL